MKGYFTIKWSIYFNFHIFSSFKKKINIDKCHLGIALCCEKLSIFTGKSKNNIAKVWAAWISLPSAKMNVRFGTKPQSWLPQRCVLTNLLAYKNCSTHIVISG